MLWGYKRLRVGLLRNFLLWLGITTTSLGVKPSMPLGSLLIPTYDYLRAYITIQTSESSQVLALLPLSILSKYLRLLQQIKLLLFLWKLQLTLAKMMAKGKKLKLLRARKRTKIREKARPQIPPSLSPSKLLTQKLPRQKLRTLVLLIHLFSLFTAFVCFFFRHIFHPHYQ